MPRFKANGVYAQAEVIKEGHLQLEFDARRIPGCAQVQYYLYLLPPEPIADEPSGDTVSELPATTSVRRAPPARQWQFATPLGRERVSFRGLPVGIYNLITVGLDASGQRVSAPSRPMLVQHGGEAAWQAFYLRKDTLRPELKGHTAPTFGKIRAPRPVASLPVLVMSPVNKVLKPGEQANFTARVSNTKEALQVRWVLVGPGKLLVSRDTLQATYTAPPEGEHRARLRCRLDDSEVEEQHANIIVSDIPEGEEPEELLLGE